MKKSLHKQSAILVTLGLLLLTTSALAAIEADVALNTTVKATGSTLVNTSVNVTSSSSVQSEAQIQKTTTSSRITSTADTRTSISLPVNISLDTDLKNYENSILLKEDAVAKIQAK